MMVNAIKSHLRFRLNDFVLMAKVKPVIKANSEQVSFKVLRNYFKSFHNCCVSFIARIKIEIYIFNESDADGAAGWSCVFPLFCVFAFMCCAAASEFISLTVVFFLFIQSCM